MSYKINNTVDADRMQKVIAEQIAEDIYNKDLGLVVIEGFDCCGKSTLIKKIQDELYRVHDRDSVVHRMNYTVFREVLPRNSWYINGLSVVEFALNQHKLCGDGAPVIIMDRGLPTSYAYDVINNIDNDIPKVTDFFRSIMKYPEELSGSFGKVYIIKPTEDTYNFLRNLANDSGRVDEVEEPDTKLKEKVETLMIDWCQDNKIPHKVITY